MKRLIRIFIILSVLDLLGLGALWFEYSTILAKQGEEEGLRKEIVDEKQKGTEFTVTQKIVTQAERESGALDKYFYDPREESQINFVAQMEALAAPAGVLIETRSLDLSGGTTPGFHGEFAVKGTWRDLYYLLRLVETFPAHVVINRFSAAAEKKDIGTAVWSGGLSIDLVSLKTP